ncbi:MAG: dihydropteroate synthase [Thermodesulfobacteriota bacterium]
MNGNIQINTDTPPGPALLKARDRVLNTSKTLVMGAINLTPDSFYEPSRAGAVDEAVSRVERMLAEGADIVDMGAESTRPGSEPVPVSEETARLMPVLEQCVKRFENAVISVDTTKAPVAALALDAGAAMINDISGLTFEESVAENVARAGAAIVLSHTPARPAAMQSMTNYENLMETVTGSLKQSAEKALAAGVSRDSIVVDPGIGFGKTESQNLEILNRLDELTELRHPVLVGTSRKSFIGGVLGGIPAGERLEGTAATVAIAIMKGAAIVRVHDVKEMARVARMSDAIKNRMPA